MYEDKNYDVIADKIVDMYMNIAEEAKSKPNNTRNLKLMLKKPSTEYWNAYTQLNELEVELLNIAVYTSAIKAGLPGTTVLGLLKSGCEDFKYQKEQLGDYSTKSNNIQATKEALQKVQTYQPSIDSVVEPEIVGIGKLDPGFQAAAQSRLEEIFG